jgi:hypothetical protein
LCETVGLKAFWTEAGPSGQAQEALRLMLAVDDWERSPDISYRQYDMFWLAWAVWDEWPVLSFANMLKNLTSEQLRMVGELLIALSAGSSGVSDWLAHYAAR